MTRPVIRPSGHEREALAAEIRRICKEAAGYYGLTTRDEMRNCHWLLSVGAGRQIYRLSAPKKLRARKPARKGKR